MEKEKLVELGVCSRPHGIKGGFQFKLHNTEESVLGDGLTIYLFPYGAASSIKTDGEAFTIKSIQFGNKTICYLDEVTDRNIVEDMLPFTIFFPRDKFPEPAEGEVYLRDLLGLKVISPTGEEMGVVHSHYDNGAQPVLKLKLNNQFMELPFTENFFPEMNLEEKTITLIMPEFDE